jgi:hypothetical protein
MIGLDADLEGHRLRCHNLNSGLHTHLDRHTLHHHHGVNHDLNSNLNESLQNHLDRHMLHHHGMHIVLHNSFIDHNLHSGLENSLYYCQQ